MLALLPCSASASHHEPEHAALGKVRIVIQPGNLQPLHGQDASGKRSVVRHAQPLEGGYFGEVDALHRLGRGVDRAQINRLAKSEVVRMKETAAAVRMRRIAENLQQLAFDVAPEIVRIHADGDFYFERNLDRTLYLDVLTGHSVPLHEADHVFLESGINSPSAQAVHGYEDGLP